MGMRVFADVATCVASSLGDETTAAALARRAVAAVVEKRAAPARRLSKGVVVGAEHRKTEVGAVVE